MNRKKIWERIAYILMPVLLYLAVTTVISGVLPAGDVSVRVLIADGLCIPLLAAWYLRDRQREREGCIQAGGNGKTDGKKVDAGQWVLRCALCVLTGAVLSALSSALMNALGIYGRFSNEVQEAYAASLPIWLILGPGLAAPVCEELVYRGLLHHRMKRELPLHAAAVLSAAAFAIGHGNMIQFLYAFPMGLLFCGAGEIAGGNVILPIMLHLGSNLYAAMMSIAAQGKL